MHIHMAMTAVASIPEVSIDDSIFVRGLNCQMNSALPALHFVPSASVLWMHLLS